MRQSFSPTTNTPLLKQFQTLPGVGKSIAQDLVEMGFHSLEDIKKQNPEDMYEQLNTLRGVVIDPCMLYTFRCVHYFLNTPKHKQEPELLKWWNWKK
ncbi:MAG: helix-hairpin-helix domain-containing protein [Patescibacteria group bacterium]